MSYLEKIFEIWHILYDNNNKDTEKTIEEHFHVDYVQSINCIIMDRSTYIDHVNKQKMNMKTMTFNCTQHIEQGDKIFVIYTVKGENSKGSAVDAEVISYFEFKEEKIFRIHGQVHLLQGNLSDIDIEK